MKSSKFFIIYFTILLFIFSNIVFAATASTNYKFDDETYADIPGEVIDSIGSFHAVAQLAQPVEGKVCQAVDLTRTSVDDFVELPVDVLEDKISFSIAAWFKTSTMNQGQAIISGGNSHSTDNEVLLFMEAETSANKGFTFIREGSSVRFDYPSGITTLADDQWHHFAISSGAGQACLYLDGDQVSCKNQNTGVIDLSQLVLGQELDNDSVVSLSRNKTVIQSSSRPDVINGNTIFTRPELAIDGNTNGNLAQGSVSTTAASDFEATNAASPGTPPGGLPALNQPWWQVDLGVQHDLSEVVVWSRTLSGGATDLGDFYLIVSEEDLTGQSLSDILALAASSNKVYTQLITANMNIINKEIPLTEVYGRFVRIQLTSTDTPLRLAEVEVFGEENIAENQTASQSSKFNAFQPTTFLAGEAVDGDTNGIIINNISISTADSSSHTATGDFSPWWQVDLGSSTVPSHNNISKIRLWNRTDCCIARLSEFFIFISDNDMSTRTLDDLLADSTVYKQYVDSLNGEDNIVLVQGNIQGRYVKIQRIEHTTQEHLTLAEVQVFGTIILDGADDNQSFIGLMDEVVIYDGITSPSEIKQLYDFQNNSLDLDGTPIDCSIAVAQYHFEDEVWNGTTNEVTDFSSNDLHGTAVSNVSPAVYSELFTESDDPALSGDPGTCGYAGFASSNQQYLEIPNNERLNPDGNFSIAAWVRPTGGQGTFRAVLSSRLTFDGVRQGFVLYADKNDKWSIWTATGEGFFHQGISNASVILNEWVHITVTFKSEYQVGDVHFGTKSIYINGDIDNPAYSESNVPYIANRETPFLIGAANEGTLSNHSTSFHFEGEIDEIQVYQFHLQPETVQQVFNERHPCALPIPRANYRFDECGYTGTGNEVLDQSRLLSNGTSVFSGSVPNLSTFVTDGVPDAQEATILRSGVVNHSLDLSFNNEEGKADWAQLPSTVLNGVDDFSISMWLNTTTTANRRRVFQALGSDVETDEVEISIIDNLRLSVRVKNNRQTLNSSISMTDGSWHHIVITRKDNLACLYVDGTFQECKNSVDEGVLAVTNTNAIVLGQGQTIFGGGFEVQQNFIGQMDELMIFDSVLSGEAISTIYTNQQAGNNYDGSTRAAIECLHHYEIVHDGTGLTCEAEQVTIKACSNAACTIVDTGSTSLNFNITNPSAATSTVASPTFTGSVDLNLNHLTAEELTLSVSNTSVVATNPQTCTGFGDSCNITFANAGFRFLTGTAISPGVTTIPSQISGRIFPEPLRLQAVQTNTVTGVCEGIFRNKTNVTVSLSQQNVTPDDDNAGLSFQVSAASNTVSGGVNIAKHNVTTPVFTPVALTFESGSVATIPNPRYLDAGQINLQASYLHTPVIAAGVSASVPASVTILGSSNNFWVKPERFQIAARQSSAAGGAISGSTATDRTTHVAGNDFYFSVQALNSLDEVVENYRQQDGQLQLSVRRLFPTDDNGGVNGRFTYASASGASSTTGTTFSNVTLNSFISGTRGISAFTQAQYDEVGIIEVDVQDANYGSLNTNSDAEDLVPEGLVPAGAITVGRFIPDHFTVSVLAQGTIENQKNGQANFVYTGETLNTSSAIGAISYGIQPEILITAENAAGATTENYTGDFMMLDIDDIMTTDPTTDATISGAVGTLTGLTANIITGNLSAVSGASGTISYTYSANDNYVYTRDENSLIDEYTPDINLQIDSIIDADGVVAQDSDGTGTNDPAGIITLHPQPTATGLMVRFGRLVLQNAYGPETSPLRAPLSVEVFDGANFGIHTNESFLTPTIGTKTPTLTNLWDYALVDVGAVDDIEITDTNASIINGFNMGRQNSVFFSAPNSIGTLEWEYEVPAWLKFDWDNTDSNRDGPYDDNPVATLTFGIYRGNDRIISWRELNE